MAISLAVASGLSFIIEEDISVKWPNDIIAGDKKVSGILIENQSVGSQLTTTIVGIGINVNQRTLSYPAAASLIQVTGRTFDLNEIFQVVLSEVESWYMQLRSGAHHVISEAYHVKLYRRGVPQVFAASGVEFTGTISGVDESGRLRVTVGGEERKFSLKEITMLR